MFLHHVRGRKNPEVLKTILLFTAGNPSNWTRTLAAGRKAKDSGIQIGIATRREDVINEKNFRKLSSGRMMWFGDEHDHFKTLNQLIDTGSLCQVMEKPAEVSLKSSEYVTPEMLKKIVFLHESVHMHHSMHSLL